MKFLVFQHITVEHPGIFREFMQQDGISWDTIELDAGDTIPELSQYDALLVMGGPMDVWQEDEYPWLVDEKRAIKDAVIDQQIPYLGFCLGHQLLAAALDGEVSMMTQPEVGVMPVQITAAGAQSHFLQQINNPLNVLQWHSAGVNKAPTGSQILAGSEICPIQALQIGDHAFSMQFHIEVTKDTVSEWAAVPEYAASLERTLGPNAIHRFERQLIENLPSFQRGAKQIYDNFTKIL